MSQSTDKYGYKHWTLEQPPRCFNVGMGALTRAKSKRNRNHKWHAIVQRYGLHVEICVGPITHKEACAWEIEHILREDTYTTNHSHYDPIDIRCNFTKGGEGGEGGVGHVVSLELRKQISERRKRTKTSDQTKQKLSELFDDVVYKQRHSEATSIGTKQAYAADPTLSLAISIRVSGSGNPMFGTKGGFFGKRHKLSSKQKVAAALMGNQHTKGRKRPKDERERIAVKQQILTKSDVAQIQQLHASGTHYVELMSQFKCSYSILRRAIRGIYKALK